MQIIDAACKIDSGFQKYKKQNRSRHAMTVLKKNSCYQLHKSHRLVFFIVFFFFFFFFSFVTVLFLNLSLKFISIGQSSLFDIYGTYLLLK